MINIRKKSKTKSSNDLINILDIKGNFLYSKDNKIFTYIKVGNINLDLLSEEEKYLKVNLLTQEFSSNNIKFKFYSVTKTIDLEYLLDDLQNLYNNSKDNMVKTILMKQIKEIINDSMQGNTLERQTYLILSNEYVEGIEKELYKNANSIVTKFINCNMEAEILEENDIIQLCVAFFNPNLAYKEDQEYKDNIPIIKKMEVENKCMMKKNIYR